jgi:hypothetical protein
METIAYFLEHGRQLYNKMPQILSYDVLGSGDLVLCRLSIEIAFPPQHLETQLQETPPLDPPFCMPLCSSTPVSNIFRFEQSRCLGVGTEWCQVASSVPMPVSWIVFQCEATYLVTNN